MSRILFQAARELIVMKQYQPARSVLSSMGDDPTAQLWLNKLDAIAPLVPEPSEMSDEELISNLNNRECLKELLIRLLFHLQTEEDFLTDQQNGDVFAELLVAKLEKGEEVDERVLRLLAILLQEQYHSHYDYWAQENPFIRRLVSIASTSGLGARQAWKVIRPIESLQTYNAWASVKYSETIEISELDDQRGVFGIKSRAVVLKKEGQVLVQITLTPRISRKARSSNVGIDVPAHLFSLVNKHPFGVQTLLKIAFEEVSLMNLVVDSTEDERQSERDGYETFEKDIAPYLDDD